jgi:hypothetical protein
MCKINPLQVKSVQKKQKKKLCGNFASLRALLLFGLRP